MAKAITAAERRIRYAGFDVIKDTVEIDETILPNDSTEIEGCFGEVLIEIPRATFGGLGTTDIFERALELANQRLPYGIKSITWRHAYEGADAFMRFTVDTWEAVSQEERDQDTFEAAQDERFERNREARLE